MFFYCSICFSLNWRRVKDPQFQACMTLRGITWAPLRGCRVARAQGAKKKKKRFARCLRSCKVGSVASPPTVLPTFIVDFDCLHAIRMSRALRQRHASPFSLLFFF